MDAKEFIDLLTNHDLVRQKSVEELKKLSLEFPYSQPVQLLYAIRLSQSSEYLFNRQLGKTSILTNDRSILFDLFEREEDNVIHSPTEQTAAISAVEPQQNEVKEDSATKENSFSGAMKEPETVDQDDHRLHQSVLETIPPGPPKDEVQADEPIVQDSKPNENQSLKDRVKTILEENRRLREKYEGSGKENSAINQRISGIRNRLDQIKEKQEQLGISDTEGEERPIPPPDPGTEEILIPEPAAEPIAFSIEEEEYSADESALIEETQSSLEPEPLDEIAEAEAVEEPSIEEEPKEEAVFVIEDETISIQEVEGEEHSFVDWFQRLSEPTVVEEKEAIAEESPEEITLVIQEEEVIMESEEIEDDIPRETPISDKFELFDSFAEKLPELKRKKQEQPLRRIRSEQSDLNEEESSLVTETLAKVYVQQKHYDKAIKAYEILRLKYPEKSGFFADRIFEIKTLRNS